jgi:redox-sensitive bicupin YhaK (pirin superfamily)
MMTLRRSAERGFADHGWLRSFHSFSFASYFDPAHMGFGPLRVINEDRVMAGAGFGTHPHHDMEIISYVLDGELSHRDSMGNGSVIRPGDVQRMSAGSGVTHSEFNHARQETHFLQIWIEPAVRGIAPSYAQKHFAPAAKRGRLCLVAAPDEAQGAVQIHQDARLFVGLFDASEQATLALAQGRRGYVHLMRGTLVVNGELLHAGDAAQIQEISSIKLGEGTEAEVLVFDLP